MRKYVSCIDSVRGLSPRRYGHYVTGNREPDLQTLVRICKALNMTPNQLLGFDEKTKKKTAREKLVEKLLAAAEVLDNSPLGNAVRQVEVTTQAT